jgi:hypothetical protein
MPARTSSKSIKPRALRRKLLVSARLRQGASWSDASIVNISARGLMIRSSRPMAAGSEVEVRRGNLSIIARVVWRDGARSGLHSDEIIPVDLIMGAESPTLPAAGTTRGKHAGRLRREERSRTAARRIEFVATIAIGGALAAAGMIMVEKAFARPLASVAAVLGG